VGRRQPEARQRLQEAALELFEEHGYRNTTAAGIAARAGVTERTFFRHFPDKRDVLVVDHQRLQQRLLEAADSQPDGLSPLAVATAALEAVAGLLDQHRDRQARRSRIIRETPELSERELTKMAAWGAALADRLRERGVPAADAGLAAAVAIATFISTYQRWDHEPAACLVTLL